MGCADPLRRGFGPPHQCHLGSVASFHIHADVRLHIPLTRHNDRPEQNVDPLDASTGMFNSTRNTLLYTRLPWSQASPQSIGCIDGSCHGWDYFSAVCWFAIRDVFEGLGGALDIYIYKYMFMYIFIYIYLISTRKYMCVCVCVRVCARVRRKKKRRILLL